MLMHFRDRTYRAVAFGHFVVDLLNGMGPVLLAALAVPLALSNGQIGLALTLYTMCGSLAQPLFGWLMDRYKGRSVLLAGVGLAWMVVCYIGVGLAHSWALLLPLFLAASLGSALFHPVATANAAAAAVRERLGSGTALFFFSGQVGLAAGPALAGLIFGLIGGYGALPLALAGVPLVFLMLRAPAVNTGPGSGAKREILRAGTFAVVAFIALVAVRSSIQAAYMAFLPKLFADRAWTPAAYGALLAIFSFAAAIGNIVTGDVADRYGMRAATVWPLLLSIPAGLIALWAPSVLAAYGGAALAGLLIGGQHSVLVVHAQRLLPVGSGLASGLILGGTFAAGGVGTWLAGIAADRVGLLEVMQVITLLALPCAVLALTLPGRVPQVVEAQAGAAA